MKKNRNSFFSEASMNYTNYNPNMNMAANAPFQSAQNYNAYYAGPNPNQNIGLMGGASDLESRLAKMERQISRLEHRVTKLENQSTYLSGDDYDSTTNNMYML